MSARIADELRLLKSWYTHLEYLEDGHWVRIQGYPVPDSIWAVNLVEVCFQIPEALPGQGPYGFYARPEMRLRTGSPPPNNYKYPVPTPFGDDWGKFSWQLEPWRPGAKPSEGSNILDFARSFYDRFREGV